MDLQLAGRVFLLTGATRGLGFATAQCLVAEGAKVVVAGRDSDQANQAAERLGGEAHALGVSADLAGPDAPERLVEATLDWFGRIDGALLSVGGPPPGTALAATDEQWRAAFESVFLGVIRMTREITLALSPGGVIGFVLSTSARTPITGLGISNGLRPGLLGVTKDMADELGPRGIRVVSLLPGGIATDRIAELHAATGDADAAKANAEAGIPLRRLGEPAEFGRTAAFLLSPAASYLTGIAVPVDGGALRSL